MEIINSGAESRVSLGLASKRIHSQCVGLAIVVGKRLGCRTDKPAVPSLSPNGKIADSSVLPRRTSSQTLQTASHNLDTQRRAYAGGVEISISGAENWVSLVEGYKTSYGELVLARV